VVNPNETIAACFEIHERRLATNEQTEGTQKQPGAMAEDTLEIQRHVWPLF
jgi:hypothetical protein